MSQLYLYACEWHDEDGQARFMIVSANSYVDAQSVVTKEKIKEEVQIKSIGATTAHPSNTVIYKQELVSIAGD